jgi:glycosyltransferase involved in cell wall biosynthesis
MLVSVGMLARNEEARIARTLRSLFRQSVFTSPELLPAVQWELIVVPNGCSDATARVAKEAIAQCLAGLAAKNVAASVVELEVGGKSLAWNRYVHEFSSEQAEAIVMLDADIEFDHPDTIRNSLAELAANRAADVVVDLPLSDLWRRPKKSLLERMRVKLSGERLAGPPGVAGSFYCARARVLRGIWMPAGLASEDGFVMAMAVTDLFRREPDPKKVARAKDASHFYEAASLIGVFRHELRLAIGTALNCYLGWDFLRFATDPTGPGAGALIKNQHERDADWFRKLVHNAIANRGWWVLPRGMLFARFNALRGLAPAAKLRRLLLALVGFGFDLVIFLAANRRLKKGAAVGYW